MALFAESYAEARRAFRAAMKRLGGRLGSASLPGVGAQGEALSVDWAVVGPAGASGTLLSISGVHGAEGHAGSAAQRAFAAMFDPRELGEDCNLVMIHALNPWGVSHGHRTDADNVDLSRNFCDFDAPLRSNPHYARVHDTICPDRWDDGLSSRVGALFQSMTEELGAAAALTAFTGGQHSHPNGIGFGGVRPSPSHAAFARIVESELSACRRMAYLEWHTGFGDYGRPLVVALDAPGTAPRNRMARWWADQGLQGEDEAFDSGETPDWSGLLLPGLRRLAPHIEIAGAPIEIGTVSNFEAFEAVMIDRWLRLGLELGSADLRSALRARLRAAYDPADPAWRAQVVEIGRSMHVAALRGLRAWQREARAEAQAGPSRRASTMARIGITDPRPLSEPMEDRPCRTPRKPTAWLPMPICARWSRSCGRPIRVSTSGSCSVRSPAMATDRASATGRSSRHWRHCYRRPLPPRGPNPEASVFWPSPATDRRVAISYGLGPMAAAAPQGRWGVLDVFDLTRQPDLIQPAYAFDLLFLTAGLSLVGIVLYVCWRRPWRMLFYLPIALAWAAGAAWMTWHDIRHTQAVRALVRSGQFASVEGCLDRFHPGLANPSEADSGLEHWSVAGQEFLYAADEVRLGYHRVEPSGGLVHADSWVRVGYVRDDMRGHNDIVRLEVRQHACPAVPDPWPK